MHMERGFPQNTTMVSRGEPKWLRGIQVHWRRIIILQCMHIIVHIDIYALSLYSTLHAVAINSVPRTKLTTYTDIVSNVATIDVT